MSKNLLKIELNQYGKKTIFERKGVDKYLIYSSKFSKKPLKRLYFLFLKEYIEENINLFDLKNNNEKSNSKLFFNLFFDDGEMISLFQSSSNNDKQNQFLNNVANILNHLLNGTYKAYEYRFKSLGKIDFNLSLEREESNVYKFIDGSIIFDNPKMIAPFDIRYFFFPIEEGTFSFVVRKTSSVFYTTDDVYNLKINKDLSIEKVK